MYKVAQAFWCALVACYLHATGFSKFKRHVINFYRNLCINKTQNNMTLRKINSRRHVVETACFKHFITYICGGGYARFIFRFIYNSELYRYKKLMKF